MEEDDCDMIQVKDLEENTFCRICLERGEPETYLCIPCKCFGSIAYIHPDCLKEWIKESGSVECEICHSVYKRRWSIWAYEQNLIRSANSPQANQANVQVQDDDIASWKVLLMFLGICSLFGVIAFLTAKQNFGSMNMNQTIEVGFRAVVITVVISLMIFTTFARYNLGILLIPNE
jgi:RING-variant domain